MHAAPALQINVSRMQPRIRKRLTVRRTQSTGELSLTILEYDCVNSKNKEVSCSIRMPFSTTIVKVKFTLPDLVAGGVRELSIFPA